MKAIFLIAFNFMREQRWPILVLLLWVVGLAFLGAVIDVRTARDDMLLIFKQCGIYGFAFAVFFGGSAIYNERRSRRILAVLSKSIERGHYLAGLLCGIGFAAALYYFAMGLTGTSILSGAGISSAMLWTLMAYLMVASLLGAAVAVFFSTFLHPLAATAAAFTTLALPAALAKLFGGIWLYVLPVYKLMESFLMYSFESNAGPQWAPVGWAVLEIIFFWLASGWIFARRDVAVAVE